jgi:recombination protein RecA
MAKKKAGRKKLVAPGLNDVIANLNKEYGEGTVVRGSDKKWVRSPARLSTGCLSLDLALGRGAARGRILHLYGLFSSAKSSLLYGMIREAQKLGERCAIVVIEEFDPEWAEAHGVDLDALDLAFPESANAGVDIADSLVRSDSYGVVGYDSLAAGATLAMLERSASQADLTGVAARLNSQFMARLASALNAKPKNRLNETAVVLINQMRVDFAGFHAIEKPTGGRALGFHTSQGVKLGYRKSEDVFTKEGFFAGMAKFHASQDGDILLRRRCQFIVEKNKTFRPMLSGGFWFNAAPGELHEVGVDRAEETVRLGVLAGVIKQAGPWLSFESQKWQGAEAARVWMFNNEQEMLSIQELIRQRVFDDGVEIQQEDTEQVVEAILDSEQHEVPNWEDLLELGVERGLIIRKGPAWLLWKPTGVKFRKKEFAGLLASTDWGDQIRGTTGEASSDPVPEQSEPEHQRKKQAKRGGRSKKTRRKKAAGKR